MKIGVFVDDYVPQDGGAFSLQNDVLEELIRVARQTKHQWVVISKNTEFTDRLKAAGIDFVRFSSPGVAEKISWFFARTWPNFRNRFKWSSKLDRMAKKAGIQFLWFLGQRPQDVDIPYMTVVFDLQHRLQPWFPEVSEFGEWEIRERGFSRHLGRASAIIAGTEAGRKEIADFFRIPMDRIHVLRHPAPNYALRTKAVKEDVTKFDLPADFLFYPAQFWAHKNHANLLYALKALKGKGRIVNMVFAGSDFGNKNYIENLAVSLGVQGQVTFLGFVGRDELIVLYQNAKALVYPSFFGPENLPPLEAFALGCPVIAADVSGAKEQLGDAAILVDPAKPDEMANAIAKIYDDSTACEQLIARGRERAQSWTAKEFVNGALKILDGFEAVRRTWN
jgi:glycosyltransferase involved in cell wall biosynthesis